MIPWEKIDRVKIPGHEKYLTLLKRGDEFSIRTPETELMNSRRHGSEDSLAEIPCSRIHGKSCVRVLIGGLGMGYTVATALANLSADARVTISELIPAVVRWNREHLAHLAGMPLADPRVSVREEDVADTIRKSTEEWDAILLDVDNGPDGLVQKANDRLYCKSGLKTAYSALRSGGILAVWSSGANESFTRRLAQCGFRTEVAGRRARNTGKGSRHTIWLAEKP